MRDLIEQLELYNGNRYHEISTIIDDFIKNKDLEYEKISLEVKSEMIIFRLYFSNVETVWNSHYWPLWHSTDQNGNIHELPARWDIALEVLQYWKNRSKETKNIFLKFRYLDVLYDLSKKITNKDIEFDLKIDLLNTGIKIIEKNILEKIDWVELLKRLLNIALALNSQEYIKKLEFLIVFYEDKIFEINAYWYWGFAYDLLIRNKKIYRNIEWIREIKIISRLEEIWDNLEEDFYWLELVTERLMHYYDIKDIQEDIVRIFWKIKNVFYGMFKDENIDKLIILNNFKKILALSKKFQHYKEVKRMRDEIINFYQNNFKNRRFDLQEIKSSFSISDKEMNDYVKSFFVFNENIKIISFIVYHFMTKKNNILMDFKKQTEEYPLLQFCQNWYISDDNFIANIIDGEGHLYKHALFHIQLTSIFMKEVLDTFVNRVSLESLMNEFRKDSFYDEQDLILLEKILQKYYSKDYLSFSALAIPFIERTVRILSEALWKTVINNKEGNIEYISLDSLLTNGIFWEIFTDNQGDVEFYFQTILTKSEGWNLRNRFAHWINFFDRRPESDRLFHILLFFTRIKVSEK